MKRYPIDPVPAPRQVRSDLWDPRNSVLRYRAFRDEVRLHKVKIRDGSLIRFLMPMPESWSKAKRAKMLGEPHRQKPDLDNLLKALLDSVFENDQHISRIFIEKEWAESGGIEICHPIGLIIP